MNDEELIMDMGRYNLEQFLNKIMGSRFYREGYEFFDLPRRKYLLKRIGEKCPIARSEKFQKDFIGIMSGTSPHILYWYSPDMYTASLKDEQKACIESATIEGLQEMKLWEEEMTPEELVTINGYLTWKRRESIIKKRREIRRGKGLPHAGTRGKGKHRTKTRKSRKTK